MSASFWVGFEKRAAISKHAVSLTGMMGGLRSGLKTMGSPGNIGKALGPKSGVSVAPRSVTPPLPAPNKISVKSNMAPRATGVMPAMPKIPKPAAQKSRGVSSTTI